jgi:tyrosinase
MNPEGTSRRDVLKACLSAGVGALAATPQTSGAQAASPSPTPVPTTRPLGTRRDIATLAPDGPEIRAYKAGVAAMKKRPAGQFDNWLTQASIHQNFCPHGNYFFLPWHRAYLYYFEQLCRQASGDSSFQLPYWDWTRDPQLPTEFWGDASNPLFDGTRQIGPNDSADPDFVGPEVIDEILQLEDFYAFASAKALESCSPPGPALQRKRCGYGLLEGRPHNYIHGWISGNMGTFLSPRDPIFWLHHCNIDRLWSAWNEQHANSADPDWLNFEFAQNFYAADGSKVNVKVAAVLDTRLLGYTYDRSNLTLPVPAPAPTPEQGLFAAEAVNARAAVGNAPVGVRLAPGADLRARIDTLASATRTGRGGTLRLTLAGVQPPRTPTGVRVFVNCPYATAETPTNDPHYVGSFTFFEHGDSAGMSSAEHAEHSGGTRTFFMNAGPALRRLRRARRLASTEDVQVHFVPVPLRRTGRQDASTERVAPTKISLAFVP